jgi:hypothetical protein
VSTVGYGWLAQPFLESPLGPHQSPSPGSSHTPPSAPPYAPPTPVPLARARPGGPRRSTRATVRPLARLAAWSIGWAPPSGIWNRTDRGLETVPDAQPPSYLGLRNTVNGVVSRLRDRTPTLACLDEPATYASAGTHPVACCEAVQADGIEAKWRADLALHGPVDFESIAPVDEGRTLVHPIEHEDPRSNRRPHPYHRCAGGL